MDEKKIIRYSLIIPLLITGLIWMTKFFEVSMEMDFIPGGVEPRTLSGLKGILLSPLIHSDWKHLFDNTVPLFLLSFALFYFYRAIAYPIFFWLYLFSGILLWTIGRDAYHIGASGLIYGLASFLFLSGVLRKITNLMAISLLVVFLYGSLVWGLLPFDYQVSWEGHLSGALVGLTLAVWYRGEGPERPKASWELEEESGSSEEGLNRADEHSGAPEGESLRKGQATSALDDESTDP